MLLIRLYNELVCLLKYYYVKGGSENQVLATLVTVWIGGHRNGGKDGIKVFGKEVIKHADYNQLKHWQVIDSFTNLNIQSKRNQ